MTAVIPGESKNQFNLVVAGAAAGGLDLQDVRAHRRRSTQGINPASTQLRLGAVPLPAGPGARRLGRLDLRPQLLGPDLGRAGDAAVGQHRLRAADARRRRRRTSPTMAHKLGVQSAAAARVPSIGLGSIAVSPLDMASAYATLAAGGIYSRPMAIRKVVLPNGKEDDQRRLGQARAQARASRTGSRRGDEDPRGERPVRARASRANFGRPAAGKTGTTDDHADAWFCGYTPNLEATVWVGYPRGRDPDGRTCTASRSRAARFPAQIWRLFMEQARRATRRRRTSPSPRRPPDSGTSRQGPWAVLGPQFTGRRPRHDDHDARRRRSRRLRPRRRRRPPSRRPPRRDARRRPSTTVAPPPPAGHRARDDHGATSRSAATTEPAATTVGGPRSAVGAARARTCALRATRARHPAPARRARGAERRPVPRREASATSTSTGSTATRCSAGDLPYRDFFVEYPPGAIPLFAGAVACPGRRLRRDLQGTDDARAASARSSASASCSRASRLVATSRSGRRSAVPRARRRSRSGPSR